MPNDIAYQNKDIISKILSQSYVNKSLNVYGLDLPRIKEVLPSNLPAIKLDEMRSDSIFLLEDDTILIVEYESVSKPENLFKYGHYAFRVAERYLELHNRIHPIIIAVIYTGEVESAADALDMGSLQISTQQVFLSSFDSEAIYQELSQKLTAGELLTDEDVMRFIILPLTLKTDKQKTVENTIEMAKKIKDERKQVFIIAGILAASDKFIDKEYSKQIRRWLTMTKVGQIFEEEKMEYGNERERKRNIELAREMLVDGEEMAKIIKYSKLTKNEISKIKEELLGA